MILNLNIYVYIKHSLVEVNPSKKLVASKKWVRQRQKKMNWLKLNKLFYMHNKNNKIVFILLILNLILLNVTEVWKSKNIRDSKTQLYELIFFLIIIIFVVQYYLYEIKIIKSYFKNFIKL